MRALAYGPRGIGPGMHGIGFGGVGAALGFLLLLAFVAVVVVLLVRASKHSHGMAVTAHGYQHGTVVADDQALKIVRERLARGEIDAEEYNRVVNALNGVFNPPASS